MKSTNDNIQHENSAVMETLESRELFSVCSIAWGGPTMVASHSTATSEIVSPRDPASGLPTGK